MTRILFTGAAGFVLSGLRGLLLLNGDDTLLRYLDHTPEQRVTYFGQSDLCDVRGREARQDGSVLRFRVEAGRLNQPVEMNLEGVHFVNDALAAIAVGLKLAVPMDRIRESLASFQNMSGRQEIFEAKGCTIIKDCYNAGPESMAAALGVLGNRPGRHIAVLGDMLELGDCSQATGPGGTLRCWGTCWSWATAPRRSTIKLAALQRKRRTWSSPSAPMPAESLTAPSPAA